MKKKKKTLFRWKKTHTVFLQEYHSHRDKQRTKKKKRRSRRNKKKTSFISFRVCVSFFFFSHLLRLYQIHSFLLRFVLCVVSSISILHSLFTCNVQSKEPNRIIVRRRKRSQRKTWFYKELAPANENRKFKTTEILRF